MTNDDLQRAANELVVEVARRALASLLDKLVELASGLPEGEQRSQLESSINRLEEELMASALP